MSVLSISFAKAREPRKWSAWFPNLPTKQIGQHIDSNQCHKYSLISMTTKWKRIVCNMILWSLEKPHEYQINTIIIPFWKKLLIFNLHTNFFKELLYKPITTDKGFITYPCMGNTQHNLWDRLWSNMLKEPMLTRQLQRAFWNSKS